MYVYSDLKNKENVFDPTYTNKHFYRKVSIFNDDVLDKSISYLKESVLKKNQFIHKYNESQKILTNKLKSYENSIENNNKNNHLNLNSHITKSPDINSSFARGNNKEADFISNENRRRKKNYSLDFKNIVTIKNIEKDNVLKYDYDGNILSAKGNEHSFAFNKNNDNNIFDKIIKKITSDSSYKNLTNFNYDEINNTKVNVKAIENKKQDLRSSNKISENSLDASKILEELIENVQKVYSIDCFQGIDNSNISNIFFKKINKKISKNNSRNKSKSRNESSYFHNNQKKFNKSKSNSFEDSLMSDSDYNNDNNNISKSFKGQTIKAKQNKENYLIEKYNNNINKQNYSNQNKEAVDKNNKDLLDKLESVQTENFGSPKQNNFNNNKKEILTKSPNSDNKKFLDFQTENKIQEQIRVKTPKNIKREMQKIFKLKKDEEFQYREVNDDPELIKQMIINLLSISKSDTESYRYYRDISKSLILGMKEKLYFWKNVIDFIYPKIFKNKLNHKNAEERVLGEGLFQLNVEDLRYHKNNKALRLELRNSLYGDENGGKYDAKKQNRVDIKDENFRDNKNLHNNINNNESINTGKNIKSENCVIDRSVIFRSAQQSNFTENAQRLLKPSTLKKINTEKRIKLAQISRKSQQQSQNVFDTKGISSNAKLNVTNFNYLPRIHLHENSESRTSRRSLKYLNNGDNNNNPDQLHYSQLNNENSNCYINEENQTRINNKPVIIDNNKYSADTKTDKNTGSKGNVHKNENYSLISDVFVNQNNNKEFHDKAEEKLISRRFRAHHPSMDLNSELNDISRINHPNSNYQSHLFSNPYNNNNKIVYFNSYNNESLTTNLENSSNFNVTEVDKNNNNNNDNANNLNNGATYNFDNIVENTMIRIKSNKRLVKINNNPQVEGKAKTNLPETQMKNDKNTFNKLSKHKKISNANEIKTSNLNSYLSKVSNSIPLTVISKSPNANFNSNESFKNNNKKDSKAFKVISPMLISSIPKYDL